MNPLVRRFRNLRCKAFYSFFVARGYSLVTLGKECRWTLCPNGLDSSSVVYSGGVGYDISFEHALVKDYGCKVFLYDPSPPGIATMKAPKNQVPEFSFTPVGLAGQRCALKLSPPKNGDKLRSSWFSEGGTVEGALEFECMDLASLMRKNGHAKIDLLKIDIEGAEYGVLQQIMKERLHINQILVEYHHSIIPTISRGRSIRSILNLISHGYRLIDNEGNNHTFIRRAQ